MYTPLSSKTSGGIGYKPLSSTAVLDKPLNVVQAQPTQKISGVVPAKPNQTITSVVDSPPIVVGPVKPQPPTPTVGPIGPIKPFAVEPLPVLPKIVPGKSRFQTPDFTPQTSDINDQDVLPTAGVGIGYKSLSLKVSGVNGTPAPLPPAKPAFPNPLGDIVAGYAPIKQYFETASKIGPKDSLGKQLAYIPGSIVGGFAEGTSNILKDIAKKTGADEFIKGIFVNPEVLGFKDLQDPKDQALRDRIDNPKTAKDFMFLVGALVGVDTGAGEIKELGTAGQEAKSVANLIKEAKTEEEFIAGVKTLKLAPEAEQGALEAYKATQEAMKTAEAPNVQEIEKTAVKTAEELRAEAKAKGLSELPKIESAKPQTGLNLEKNIQNLQTEKPPLEKPNPKPDILENSSSPSTVNPEFQNPSALDQSPNMYDNPKNSSNISYEDNVTQEGEKVKDNINPETGNVIPEAVRGGVKPPELNLKAFEDKPTFSLARETFERNIDSIASPEDAQKLKEFIVDPIRNNETARIEFTNSLKNEIKSTIIDKLGIKPGSPQDALVQIFGEKRITLDQLKVQAPENWDKIQEAAAFFRENYDNLLDKVNTVRKEFGYDAIPKRSDYFRHFSEINNVINQVGVLFRESDLPTSIAGMTDIFKPGKPFSTAELARTGNKTAFSALKGMDNYIESISKQIYHIDSVQRVRSLEKYIRQAGEAGQADLPAFVQNLNEYGNLLAGKAAKLDRAAESVIGRRIFKGAGMIKSQAGISLVAGNISSALTNFIPFTQSLSTTEKVPAIKGLLEGLISPFNGEINFIDGIKSDFLTRRFPEGKIAPTFGEKVLDKTGWLFKTVDEFTAKSIVSGKYYENLGKGIEPQQAMKLADEYAGKVLADRSFGQLPNLMGSKTAGFVTQFQTEVNNMFSFLTKDIPKMSKGNKVKMVSAFAQFTLYSYLFNDAYEQVTGRRPTLDPIYAGLTLLGQTNASKNLPLKDKAVIAGKDIAGNIPFGNLIPGLGQGGRLPIASVNPFTAKLTQGDLTELLNPISLQLKKTIQGTKAFMNGEVDNKAGKKEFNIAQTPQNLGRSVLFGQSATPEARNYYDNLGKPNTVFGGTKGMTPLPRLPKLPSLPKLPKIK